MDTTQDQSQPQDLLSLLASLLSPSEADAATRRTSAPVANQTQAVDPQTALFKQLQMSNEVKRQQMTQQNNDLRARDIAVREAKQTAATNPPDINAQLSKVLQPQAPQQPQGNMAEPLFRGVTPGTGTPFFSNYRAPEGYAPEADRQKFQQDVAAYDAQKAAAAQPKESTGGMSQADIAGASQLAKILHANNVPPETAQLIMRQTFPSLEKAKQDEAASKPLTTDQMGKLWKFNPETKDFDPVPPDMTHLTGRELQAKGFRTYSDKQRGMVDEIKDVGVALQQLRSSVADIQGKSAFDLKASQLTSGQFGGPEGAVFQKAATNFTTIFDKFLGGVRGAASPQMQAVRSKVLPTILSTQAVSDKLMGDLEDLITQMGDSRLKTVVGGEQFNAAQMNAAAEKVLKTFEAESGKPAAAASSQPKGAPANQTGIPPGRVPMLNPDGKPVTVPANQVSEALKTGYQPYGAK